MHKTVTTVDKKTVANIMEIMAEDLAKEIDFKLMSEELSNCGWSIIDLPPFDYRYKSSDIVDWAFNHCQGQFEHFGVRYVFEEKQDATLFSLKWL